MKCRHCKKVRATRPRGLCWHCFNDGAVRALHPALNRYGRRGLADEEPTSDCRPTTALPGTEEKLAVMEARAAAGQPIFHKDDPAIVHEPYLRNGCGVRLSKIFQDTEGLLGLKVSSVLEKAFYFGRGGSV